jgi:diguanylate cyclase (GGDEF)-like protein
MIENNQTTFIEHFQRCLFLTVLTIAANLFLAIPIVADATLVFGSTFVLIALVLLPSRFAAFVLLASLLSLHLTGLAWPFIALHALEVICIVALLKRSLFIMVASIIFWLCIGMPALWSFTHFKHSFLQEISVLITMQYGLNGILNAAMAASVLAIVPLKYKQAAFTQEEQTLSKNIFTICASIMVLPVLVISFIFISLSSREYETLLADKIKSNTTYVAQLTRSFLDEHKMIIEQHATLLSNETPLANVHSFMRDSQLAYPGFFNITTADKDGNLLFFAPEKFNAEVQRIPTDLRTVADREYFIESKKTGKTSISNTLLSRGIVIAPMISIASPIIKNGEFDGIIFGVINLDAIKTLRSRIESLLGNDLVIITDSSDLIIYASAEINTKPLSEFVPMPSYNYIISTLPVLMYEDTQYAYHKRLTPYGWNVYVLTESRTFTDGLKDNFVIAGVSLLVVMAVFLVFAYKLARQITAPLVSLLKTDESGNQIETKYTNSKEFSDVANKLKRSQFLMRNFENRLKQQVNEKTEQLEQLNLQLAAQAREDGMTHLLNRSGFDELAINAIKTSYRLGQPFSLALLDIDHFKQINDNYGHLFGDKCLKAFSALMQRNCKRDTDIIGRYGGEEFIILMSGKNINAHHQLMQNIHAQTRNISLKPSDGHEPVRFTVSIGICSVLGNVSLNLQDIVKLADEELYKSKGAGRDRISIMTVGYTDSI